MVVIVQEKAAELEELCRRFAVRRLALFGSAVRGDFDTRSSDLDFVVEFAPLDPSGLKSAYFGLLNELEKLFGREIDLIELRAVKNPYIRRRILEQQETLYDAA